MNINQTVNQGIKQAAGVVLLSLGLFATAHASHNSCENATTQAQINACSASDYAAEDSRLNSSYSSLQSLLTTSEKNKLKVAQRAWIDFRDKACQFDTRNSVGGSIHPTLLNSCLEGYTEQRRMQLEGQIASIQN